MNSRLKANRWLLGIPLAALALSLVACGGGDDAEANTGGAIDTATPAAAAGGGAANGAPASETITVSMTDNKFAPAKISVGAGKPVTFVAKNNGSAVHNMKVLSKAQEGKDYGSEVLVNPGKESKFTVTFQKKGIYKFQCDYHLPGMVGTIEVK